MTRVALGFRTHLGWAALVALAGPPSAPRVIERQRVELADPAVPESLDPYHAARGLALVEAEGVVHQGSTAIRAVARKALRSAVDGLVANGYEVMGSGILLAAGRLPATLDKVLASHAMVHMAEGELFRGALREASERCSLPVSGLREREAFERAGALLGLTPEQLERRVNELGRELGPPWRRDQKLAAVAAWFTLAGGSS